jgi:hypothetical protein
MTQQAGATVGAKTDSTFLVGLIMTALGIAGAMFVSAYLAWREVRDPQAMSPAAIAEAPPGCVADKVRYWVKQGPGPLTYGGYRAIESECAQLEAENRQQTERYEALKRQQEVLGPR